MANSGTGGKPEAPRQCTHSGAQSDFYYQVNNSQYLINDRCGVSSGDDCAVYVVDSLSSYVVELALPYCTYIRLWNTP
jgi:hypothetical protein